MTPDLRSHLDRLDTALGAATAGPWEVWNGCYGAAGADDTEGNIVLDYSTWVDNPEDHAQAQALTTAIVALRNAAPGLLAALRAAEALTYASDDGTEYEHNGHGPTDGEPECPACWVADLRTALALACALPDDTERTD